MEMKCTKCGLESPSGTQQCPRCGGRVQSKTLLRITGVVMIGLGGLLMAGMAVLSVATRNIIMDSDDPKATTRFNGSDDQMFLMFAVFGLVFTFGLAAATAGAWQLIFGKRNMWLVGFIFGFAIIFLLAGKAVRLFT